MQFFIGKMMKCISLFFGSGVLTAQTTEDRITQFRWYWQSNHWCYRMMFYSHFHKGPAESPDQQLCCPYLGQLWRGERTTWLMWMLTLKHVIIFLCYLWGSTNNKSLITPHLSSCHSWMKWHSLSLAEQCFFLRWTSKWHEGKISLTITALCYTAITSHDDSIQGVTK